MNFTNFLETTYSFASKNASQTLILYISHIIILKNIRCVISFLTDKTSLKTRQTLVFLYSISKEQRIICRQTHSSIFLFKTEELLITPRVEIYS